MGVSVGEREIILGVGSAVGGIGVAVGIGVLVGNAVGFGVFVGSGVGVSVGVGVTWLQSSGGT